MSNLRKTAMSSAMKRTKHTIPLHNNVEPINWSNYYDKREPIVIENGTFIMYRKGSEGIPIVCLHGGGYSGLTWALFANEITKYIKCQVFAIDMRGHGSTKTNDDDNMALETLAMDVSEITNTIFEECKTNGILIGHSMGGAVAVEATKYIEGIQGVCLIDVVEGPAMDSLSAMQGVLRHRPQCFSSLQNAIGWSYKSGQTHNLEAARISMPGQVMNYYTGVLAADEIDDENLEKELKEEIQKGESPDLFAEESRGIPEIPEECEEEEKENGEDEEVDVVEHPEENRAIKEEPDEGTSENNGDCGKPPLPKCKKLKVEEDGDAGSSNKSESTNSTSMKSPMIYTWRIDLSRTEKYWRGWFQGLSKKFLAMTCPKILLLANINGLDTALTVAQMQGKFQMQVLPRSGHAIHEDQPQKVAEIVGAFVVKHQLAIPLVPVITSMPGC